MKIFIWLVNSSLEKEDLSYIPNVQNSLRNNNKISRNSKRSTFCPANTQCVPLASCPILNNLINNECLLTNSIGDLGCGYQGSGLICCPHASDSSASSPGKLVDGQRCGTSQVQGEGYDGIGAYPWIVRIGFRNVITGEVKYPCTGSIINNRIILTAAHCALAKAENYKLFLVRAGEWMTDTAIDCGEEFCGLPVQDIAIITAQPICLPESWSVTNNNGLLVGWGKAAGQTTTPPQQQILHLPIISIQECAKVYGKTLPISEEQVCAGGELGNDACSGFGGAPLIVGILSFGSDQCGAAGVPSVYTNIKKYVSWISENTPQVYSN
ncbi:hypothetical protein NQ314_016608 [Rhamnusium bicolor]|uniref:Peptidase S1 domain-containing protein n=1 Tax=Rhamnusium bicolor TaxID=1586634 RepID=A0AAV8WWK6_9CUCU|nr:hypothetical protein NQ314_016608 [Rhamnusium bicolor]